MKLPYLWGLNVLLTADDNDLVRLYRHSLMVSLLPFNSANESVALLKRMNSANKPADADILAKQTHIFIENSDGKGVVVQMFIEGLWKLSVPLKAHCYDIESEQIVNINSRLTIGVLGLPLLRLPYYRPAFKNQSLPSNNRYDCVMLYNDLHNDDEYNYDIIKENWNMKEHKLLPIHTHFSTRKKLHNPSATDGLELIIYHDKYSGDPIRGIVIDGELTINKSIGVWTGLPLKLPDSINSVTSITLYSKTGHLQYTNVGMCSRNISKGELLYEWIPAPPEKVLQLICDDGDTNKLELVESCFAIEFSLCSGNGLKAAQYNTALRMMRTYLKGVIKRSSAEVLRFCVNECKMISALKIDLIGLILDDFECRGDGGENELIEGDSEITLLLFDWIEDVLISPYGHALDHQSKSMAAFRSQLATLSIERALHSKQVKDETNAVESVYYDCFETEDPDAKAIPLLGGPLLASIMKRVLEQESYLQSGLKFIIRLGIEDAWAIIEAPQLISPQKNILGWCVVAERLIGKSKTTPNLRVSRFLDLLRVITSNAEDSRMRLVSLLDIPDLLDKTMLPYLKYESELPKAAQLENILKSYKLIRLFLETTPEVFRIIYHL